MSKKLLIAAFDEPNHTQTPNALFDMLPDMGDAELRVTLIMIRHTLGYHREQFKMGISKLAKLAGLSDQGARDGAKSAEDRGIFKRSNPDSKKEAEWELVLLPLNPVDPQPSGGLTSTQLTPDLNQVDHIPPLKETIKENNKEKKPTSKLGDAMDGILYYAKQAQEKEIDKVEEILVILERGLRVNIARSLGNQSVARRILKDGRNVETWLSWVRADEWRASHLYLYADLEKVWRDFPQAFGTDTSMNPQGLSIE